MIEGAAVPTADHDLLDQRLRDWLANASGYFIDSSVDFADDLSGAPLGVAGRRLALPNAAWVLIEKDGQPFVLAGIQSRHPAGRECFTIFEHCVTGENRVSCWNLTGAEWSFFNDSSPVPPQA